MKIEQIDISNKKQVNQFLNLPFCLYQNVKPWVPPLNITARQVFNRDRHPYYRHGEAAFFLAIEHGQVIGRLAVLDNQTYNFQKRERTAFFYQFECLDDRPTAQALFGAAFEWARKRDLNRIIGPRGFTPFDGAGMLVKGFEYRPAFGLPYNLPYYPKLLESLGFIGFEEFVSGYVHVDENFILPEKISHIAERVKQRRGLRVASINSRRDLRAVAPQLQDLYNSILGEVSGNIQLSNEETKELIRQLIWFADPKLIKIVMKGVQPVGFSYAFPDISAALQRSGGKIFPLGWLHLLVELRRTKWINVIGGGMLEGYRGLGGTALIINESYKSCIAGQYQYAEFIQIESNDQEMLREFLGLGIDYFKTHRFYEREI